MQRTQPQKYRNRLCTRGIRALLLFVAGYGMNALFGTASARADPVPISYVVPLSVLGNQVYGSTISAPYDFGFSFSRIEEIRIDWAGTLSPGTCQNGGPPFLCFTSELAFISEGSPDSFLNSVSTPFFDQEIPLFPVSGAASLTAFLDGQGSIEIGLSLLLGTGGFTVLSPPGGFLTRANLVFVGVQVSPTCGDGVVDALEFCDDAGQAAGDGCSAVCDTEPFFVCTGEPSVCVPSLVGILKVAGVNIPSGPSTEFLAPLDVVADDSNNIFVAGGRSDNVVRIDVDDVASFFLTYTGPGPLGSMQDPALLAVDPQGNLFIAEVGVATDNVFKVDPLGTFSIVIDETGDGGANPLGNVRELTADQVGNLYVLGDNIVFKVAPSGTTEILIDSSGDGIAALDSPVGLAVDAEGNVFVSGYVSGNVFRITAEGLITEIVDATGNGTSDPYSSPRDLAIAPDGTLYIGTLDRVFAYFPNGVVTQILGPDGDGQGQTFQGSGKLVVGPEGRLYALGVGSDNVFEVDIPNGGAIREIIDATGDGIGSPLDRPLGLAVAEVGLIYVSGNYSRNVFKIVTDDFQEVTTPAVPALSETGLGILVLTTIASVCCRGRRLALVHKYQSLDSE